jgi:hypothetical protein
MPAPQDMHCSAFAASGPATADGKIVFGHITMFSLYPSLFYNVWLDVKPAKGHRVLMQTYPGGIQSGMDYYLNDAGLIVCETTIRQTRFNPDGMCLASRIRQALQYADNIDIAADILRGSNNGLYTNEWLLADTKTNEIAMLELGTAKSKLYRSSKNEWFGGTEGFYWGCNNTKDLDVRLETIPAVNAEPANMVWRPTDRDKTWLRLFNQYKGRIDANFGKTAFTTPPVAACASLDAKFTTTDMAKELKTWALFGPPLGRSWQPTDEEKKKYPEIHPMASNPWTVLDAEPPSPANGPQGRPIDLPQTLDSADKSDRSDKEREAPVPAWHGTLLPKTDADVWLAAAFADYEKIVASEKGLRERAKDGKLDRAARDRLAVALFARRSDYLAGARASADVPLANTRSQVVDDNWYRVAAGKGVLLLHELHRLLGDERFVAAMDAFGKEHAGKEVSTEEFTAAMSKAHGQPLQSFFDFWLNQSGLPVLNWDHIVRTKEPAGYAVSGVIHAENAGAVTKVDVTIDTAKGETTKTIVLDGADTKFSLTTRAEPERAWLDKYSRTAQGRGAPFTILSFQQELPQTLIIYGTADEAANNRETAEKVQRAITWSWSNFTVPFKADTEATAEDLRTHHLLLIGRPDSNRCVEQLQGTLPLTFGARSFTIRHETYAHAGTAVIAAAENPLNPRYSMVVLAGLGTDATLAAPAQWLTRDAVACEVLLLPHAGKPQVLVVPGRNQMHAWDEAAQRTDHHQ